MLLSNKTGPLFADLWIDPEQVLFLPEVVPVGFFFDFGLNMLHGRCWSSHVKHVLAGDHGCNPRQHADFDWDVGATH